MADPRDLDEVEDGVDETSTGEPQATNQPTPNRQPRWQDDPEYRKQQSKRDAELAAARREAAENAARLQRLEQGWQQQYMAQLSPEDQRAYQVQLQQSQIYEQKRQLDMEMYAIQRQRDLEAISRKTGIPIEDIEDSPTVQEAWDRGTEYLKKGRSKPAKPSREEEIEQEADDSVDYAPTPKPRGKASKLQAEYDKHRKAYNMREQLEILARADMEGVTLNEW